MREAMLRSIEPGEFNRLCPAARLRGAAPRDRRRSRHARCGGARHRGRRQCAGDDLPGALQARHHAGDHRSDLEMAVPVRPPAGRRGDRDPDLRSACNYRLTARGAEGRMSMSAPRSSISSIPTIRSASAIRARRSRALPRSRAVAGALLVHDCAYRDFADGHTPARSHVAPKGLRRLGMSFSKWLGLAGASALSPPRH